MSTTKPDASEPVAGPVEMPVRPPAAWMSDDGNRLAFHEHRDYTRPLYEGEEMVAPLLTALRHAWTGNHKAAEAYALLAAQHLEDKGERLQARCLRETVEVLTGKRAPTFVHVA